MNKKRVEAALLAGMVLPPANQDEIRRVILRRAGNTCEFCGRPNHVFAYPSLGWFRTLEAAKRHARPGEKPSRIVLTITHLDHDLENNALDNLRALCQHCRTDWDTPYQTHPMDWGTLDRAQTANTRQVKCERAAQLTLSF